MKIKTVELHDFGAFAGDHVFPVDGQGLVLVEGRNLDEPRMKSNGAGKSTLWDAVDWALWGDVPRGEPADSVIHDGFKRCTVRVCLVDDDGTEAVVERSRPSALSWVVAGKDLTAQDARETQVAIGRWLGLDREVFHAAVLFAQTDQLHFADATDAGRMEILTKILPELAVVDALEEPAKALRASLAHKLDTLSVQSATLNGTLTALQVADYSAQAKTWEETRAQRIAEYELTGRLHQESAARFRAQAATLPEVMEAGRVAEAAATTGAQVPMTTSALEAARVEQTAAARVQAVAQAEVQRCERDLARVRALRAGRCSQCGSELTVEHIAREDRSMAGAVEMTRQRYAEANLALQNAAAVVTREAQALEALRAQVRQAADGAAARWRSIRQQIDDLRSAAVAADQADSQVRAMEALIEAKRVEVNPWHAEEAKRQRSMAEVVATLGTLQAQQAEITDELAYADFWVVAAGSKGLKSYILDARLTELTDAVNEWVRLLTGGTFWVRFESQRMGKTTKTLRNAPSVRVFKYLPSGKVVERGYRSFSGGEKRRIAWAVDFGLSRLVARRATKRWDLLVLDEVFSHVDAAGGQAIVEMLHALRREKSAIFVVEHDAEFRSAFERVMVVEKRGGASRILLEVEHAKEGSEKAEGQSQGAAPGGPPAVAGQPESAATPRRHGVPRRGAVRRGNP